MLVIHGFVAPTTARKSNMTVAGRPRPHWEMAGRQGSFRARAMPDAVLSQGRAERRGEREGGGGCPRGEGVGSTATLHCSSAAVQQCGRTVDAASFPVVGPIRKNDVPRNRVQAGQSRTGALYIYIAPRVLVSSPDPDSDSGADPGSGSVRLEPRSTAAPSGSRTPAQQLGRDAPRRSQGRKSRERKTSE